MYPSPGHGEVGGQPEEEKEKGCQRRRQPASTACSTSPLYCASLAGTCFSINLGGRESLAELWSAGKDLRLLRVLLAGLGRNAPQEEEETEEGACDGVPPGSGVPASAKPGEQGG